MMMEKEMVGRRTLMKEPGEKSVSIIIPVYNVELFIKDCVSSVLNQSFTNMEIIIVNDGSTDCSLSFCKEFEKEDERIKVFTKKNGGVSDARNFGISKANGDYVFFLDGDDLIQDDTIETLLSSLDDENSIAMCGFESFKDKTHYCSDSAVNVFSPAEYTESVLKLHNNTYACGVLIPRKFLDANFFIKGRYFEDMASMFKVYEKCRKIIVIEGGFYKYRTNINSITKTIDSKKIIDFRKSSQEFIDHAASKYGISDTVLHAFLSYVYRACYVMSRDKEYLKKAKMNVKKATLMGYSKKNYIKLSFLRCILATRIMVFLKNGHKPMIAVEEGSK